MTRNRTRQAAGNGAAGDLAESAAATRDYQADVDEVLAELGATALEVVLFQQDPQAPTQWPYVGRFPAQDFNLDSVKTQHGGGNYRARMLGPDKKFIRQVTFQIHRGFKGQAATQATPAAAAAPSPSPESAALLEAIRGLTADVRALQAAPRAPQADPLEYGLKIAALVTQAGQGAKGGGAGFGDLLKVFEKGLELGDRGEVGEGAGYVTVARELGKPLLELLQRMAPPPRRLPPAPVPQNTNPAPAGEEGTAPGTPPAVPVAPPAPPAYSGPRWIANLAPLIPYGLNLAAIEKAPESFAPALYQLIPESDLDELEKAAADPGFSLAVLEAYPDTQKYRDWFTRLLETVREIILEGARDGDAETE